MFRRRRGHSPKHRRRPSVLARGGSGSVHPATPARTPEATSTSPATPFTGDAHSATGNLVPCAKEDGVSSAPTMVAPGSQVEAEAPPTSSVGSLQCADWRSVALNADTSVRASSLARNRVAHRPISPRSMRDDGCARASQPAWQDDADDMTLVRQSSVSQLSVAKQAGGNASPIAHGDVDGGEGTPQSEEGLDASDASDYAADSTLPRQQGRRQQQQRSNGASHKGRVKHTRDHSRVFNGPAAGDTTDGGVVYNKTYMPTGVRRQRMSTAVSEANDDDGDEDDVAKPATLARLRQVHSVESDTEARVKHKRGHSRVFNGVTSGNTSDGGVVYDQTYTPLGVSRRRRSRGGGVSPSLSTGGPRNDDDSDSSDEARKESGHGCDGVLRPVLVVDKRRGHKRDHSRVFNGVPSGTTSDGGVVYTPMYTPPGVTKTDVVPLTSGGTPSSVASAGIAEGSGRRRRTSKYKASDHIAEPPVHASPASLLRSLFGLLSPASAKSSKSSGHGSPGFFAAERQQRGKSPDASSTVRCVHGSLCVASSLVWCLGISCSR